MELDEFKVLLQSTPEETAGWHSATDLEQSLRRKAGSVTEKIKQSIWLELALSLLFIVIFTWMGFRYSSLYVKFFAGLALACGAAFTCFLLLLYKKIAFYEQSCPGIRQGLEQIIYILERFTKLYFQLTMIMLPVAFITGLITGYLDITGNAGAVNFNWSKATLFYIVFFFAWSVFMYFFTQWYIKKLYGNHLQQLKEQLKDIKNG